MDKSDIIAHLNRMINTEQKFVCVTRPRRFGKSLAAQMMCAYYDRSCDSRALFANLKIAKDGTFEAHLNKYPVISLDVQEARSRVRNGLDFVPMLQDRIGLELSQAWPSETAGAESVQEMMDLINSKTGTRFIVCLDEWHSIYRMDEGNAKAQEVWFEFLRSLFKGPAAKRYNEEIREAIYDIAKAVRWDGVIRSIDESRNFIDYLVHGNASGVAQILDKIHCELASIFTFNNENTLACVVLYACYTARQDFFVFRELPSGVGFVDIALLPLLDRGLPAVLVELKWNKSTDSAIEQIHIASIHLRLILIKVRASLLL